MLGQPGCKGALPDLIGPLKEAAPLADDHAAGPTSQVSKMRVPDRRHIGREALI